MKSVFDRNFIFKIRSGINSKSQFYNNYKLSHIKNDNLLARDANIRIQYSVWIDRIFAIARVAKLVRWTGLIQHFSYNHFVNAENRSCNAMPMPTSIIRLFWIKISLFWSNFVFVVFFFFFILKGIYIYA